MRFHRPARVNWPHFIQTLEDSGMSRSCISKLSGVNRASLQRLASGTAKDPTHHHGAAIIELYNWRVNHILGDENGN